MKTRARDEFLSVTATKGTVSDNELVAAPGAGFRWDLHAIHISAVDTDTSIILKSGSTEIGHGGGLNPFIMPMSESRPYMKGDSNANINITVGGSTPAAGIHLVYRKVAVA